MDNLLKKKNLLLKRMAFLYPMPVVVVGCYLNDQINWTTIAYVGIIDSKHLSISMSNTSFSNKTIKQTKQLSVNLPTKEDMKKVDETGSISGKNKDKSKLYQHFFGELHFSPYILNFPLNIGCKVVETLNYGHNDIFICMVKELFANTNLELNKAGYLEIEKIYPLLFAWDGYYSVSNRIGIPWKEWKTDK